MNTKNLGMNKGMLLAAVAGLLTIALAGCTGGESQPAVKAAPSASAAAAPTSVDLKDLKFSPATITVAAGTTVTWHNKDSFDHTVSAEDASFESGNLAGGGTWTHTFSAPGTYTYYCKPHSSGGSGSHTGMTAKIVVT